MISNFVVVIIVCEGVVCQLCVVVDHWCWFYEYWFYFWYFIFVILLEKNTAGAEKDKTNKIKNSEFFEGVW